MMLIKKMDLLTGVNSGDVVNIQSLDINSLISPLINSNTNTNKLSSTIATNILEIINSPTNISTDEIKYKSCTCVFKKSYYKTNIFGVECIIPNVYFLHF